MQDQRGYNLQEKFAEHFGGRRNDGLIRYYLGEEWYRWERNWLWTRWWGFHMDLSEAEMPVGCELMVYADKLDSSRREPGDRVVDMTVQPKDRKHICPKSRNWRENYKVIRMSHSIPELVDRFTHSNPRLRFTFTSLFLEKR